jgi:hypothetical protein
VSLAYVKCAIGGYFFDATISESHDWENTITVNPVQTGANVNDHMFAQPILYTMQIFQSDCMGSIVKGQFTAGSTRCVSAYVILNSLRLQTIPFDVITSLGNYSSMVIKSIIINKDSTTMNAMKMTVILQQAILTDATAVSISAIATAPATAAQVQTTGSTSKGKVSVVTPQSPAFGVINTGLAKLLTPTIPTTSKLPALGGIK